MQNPSPVRQHNFRFQRALAIAPHLLLAGSLLAGGSLAAQSNSATQQTLELKDPTPRPPDLQKQYGTTQDDQKRLQAAMLVRNAVRHQQAVAMASKMLQLSEALKHDTVAHQATGPTIPDAMKADQIEKLAKELKSLLKS